MSDSKDTFKIAYERERKARKVAEGYLDERTREVYQSQMLLERQFNDLMEKKQELELLVTVTKVTQESKSFNQCLQDFINVVGDMVDPYYIVVYLLEKEKSSLVASDVRWSHDEFPEKIETMIADTDYHEGKSLPGMVLLTAEATCCKEDHTSMTQERMDNMRELGIQAFALFPVTANKKVIAVIEVAITDLQKLSDRFFESCKTATVQLGGALEKQIAQKQTEKNLVLLKKSNEDLKTTQNQLFQQEKLASIGQLAAGVAHEINNPVGFCLSNLDTLGAYIDDFSKLADLNQALLEISEDKLSSEVSEQIDKIKNHMQQADMAFILEDIEQLTSDTDEGLKRVKDIVANLKSFARMDDNKTNDVNLNECIENTIKIIWNEIKYTCELKKILVDEEILIDGNSTQLGQVFLNMIVNAGHACEKNGVIEVSTALHDQCAVVTIKDNGKGIPKDVLDKIFDPFFTTKPVGVGTGLGLSISYGIIEQHGGKIEVDSEEGKGTCFMITLPVKQ